jgi:CxxC motif-containing protein (DUF1111 family)
VVRRRVGALLLVLVACAPDLPPTANPGEPLPGLDSTDLARFQAGQALFDKVYSPEEGLGPAFNENQCSACHTSPASGGTTGFERVVKATRWDSTTSTCDPLTAQGGANVRTQATPRLRARGVERETVPKDASVGRFIPPFLFGLGLVEAITDDAILAAQDSADANGDGISGRVGRTADGRVARFGRKLEFATIRDFVETALLLEMGLTSRETHRETVNGRPPPRGADPMPEPEVGEGTVALLTEFVRLLAAPAPAVARSAAHADTIARGRLLFFEVGCVACHTPSLYSDLLLHDMGPALADVCGPAAASSEVRTELLMGLRHRDRFLHDGRTGDLREAILTHGGEGEAARTAFARLPFLGQEYLLAFLKSL